MSDLYDAQNKLVAAWIPVSDFKSLQQLAVSNKVSLAAYLRAIIVDALQEEQSCISKSSNTSINHQVV